MARSRLLPLAAAVLALACNSGRGRATPTPPPTLVEVSPSDFLGDVECLDAPGAMRRYVATLFDVSEDAGAATGFELPSSGPISCTQSVAFGFVAPGHEYVAHIQAFDRTGLSPLGAGSPVMLASGGGEVLEPRWTTVCGAAPPRAGDAGADAASAEPDAGVADDASTSDEAPGDAGADADPFIDFLEDPVSPALAVQNRTIRVRGCAPLLELRPSGVTTAIVVKIEPALGNLVCGNGPDEVTTFAAAPSGRPLGAPPLPCGEAFVFENLEPDVLHEFDVWAFESGATTPTWTTSCFRVARAGVRVTASCDPLGRATPVDAGIGDAGPSEDDAGP